MVKVLVVDDSALMRKLVTDLLNKYDEIEVVGQARDGSDALAKISKLQPDVVTLDIEMPVMDGITALQQIMATKPTPVVMLSSLTQAGAVSTLKCLEIGAVDVVAKPSGAISMDIALVQQELYSKVMAASRARISNRAIARRVVTPPEPRKQTSKRGLLFIGSSTGGPRALHHVVPNLPIELGLPIVIVQHLPEGFTTHLAARLDQESGYEVREAKEGDILKPGVALVAPGGKHLRFDSKGIARLSDEAPVHGVKPAIDVTLTSLIPLFGSNMIGVILTGMGKDGAAAMKLLHEKKGATFAEREETCVVYGMPKAAFELGAVSKMVKIEDMASEIIASAAARSLESGSAA